MDWMSNSKYFSVNRHFQQFWKNFKANITDCHLSKWHILTHGEQLMTGSMAEGLTEPCHLSDLDFMRVIMKVNLGAKNAGIRRLWPVEGRPGCVWLQAKDTDPVKDDFPTVIREVDGQIYRFYSPKGIKERYHHHKRDIYDKYNQSLDNKDTEIIGPALTMSVDGKEGIKSFLLKVYNIDFTPDGKGHGEFVLDQMDQLLDLNDKTKRHSYLANSKRKYSQFIREALMMNAQSQKAGAHSDQDVYVNTQKTEALNLCDHVLAVEMINAWPLLAVEWISRKRLWPRPHVIDDIKGCGFHLVCKTSQAGDSDVEWRISFSLAELKLSDEMTSEQKTCYTIFKAIYRVAFHDSQILSSYIMKTVFLWCLERIPASQWTYEKVGERVLNLLDDLWHYIAEGRLPHYFMPEINLIEDLQQCEIQAVLNEVIDSRRHIFEYPSKSLSEYAGEGPNAANIYGLYDDTVEKHLCDHIKDYLALPLETPGPLDPEFRLSCKYNEAFKSLAGASLVNITLKERIVKMHQMLQEQRYTPLDYKLFMDESNELDLVTPVDDKLQELFLLKIKAFISGNPGDTHNTLLYAGTLLCCMGVFVPKECVVDVENEYVKNCGFTSDEETTVESNQQKEKAEKEECQKNILIMKLKGLGMAVKEYTDRLLPTDEDKTSEEGLDVLAQTTLLLEELVKKN